MERAILKTSEVAERFGVARGTVWRWAKAGFIPAFKVANQIRKGGGKPYSWRFRIQDIEQWEKRQREKF